VPGAVVHGVFGDRMAIVISLTRRRKKRALRGIEWVILS